MRSKIILNVSIIIFLISIISLQILFKKTDSSPQITINGQEFKVELAKTAKEHEKGLSARPSLAKNQGMLFLFNSPARYSFWMKGMNFPIDIIFINGNRIVSISENAKVPVSRENLPVYQPLQPADKVFEINAGLSEKYGIKIGDLVDIKL